MLCHILWISAWTLLAHWFCWGGRDIRASLTFITLEFGPPFECLTFEGGNYGQFSNRVLGLPAKQLGPTFCYGKPTRSTKRLRYHANRSATMQNFSDSDARFRNAGHKTFALYFEVRLVFKPVRHTSGSVKYSVPTCGCAYERSSFPARHKAD